MRVAIIAKKRKEDVQGFSLSGPTEIEKEVKLQVHTDFNVCAIISMCAKAFVDTYGLLLGIKHTAPVGTRNMAVV